LPLTTGPPRGRERSPVSASTLVDDALDKPRGAGRVSLTPAAGPL